MKRILAILLIICTIVSIVSLTGCQNKQESSQTKPGSTIDATKIKFDVDNMEKYDFWTLKNKVNEPGPKDITWEEKKFDDDFVYVSTTELQFNAEELISQLKANNAVRKMFDNIYTYSGEYHELVYDEDDNEFDIPRDYTIITGYNSEHGQTFEVRAVTFRNHYTTPYVIEFNIHGIPQDQFSQDMIYDMAKMIYGNYADYLIYAKDKDGKYYIEDEEPLRNGSQMVEWYGSENSKYEFRREIWDDNDEVEVTLLIEVMEDEKHNPLSHQFPIETKYYKEGQYTPDKVLVTKEKFTSGNFNELANIAFNHIEKYDHPSLFYWEYNSCTHENGVAQEFFAMDLNALDKSGLVQGSLMYEMSLSQDKDASYLTLSVTLHEAYNVDTNNQEYLNKAIDIFESMFYDLKIGEMTYKNGEDLDKDVTITIDGKKHNAVFSFSEFGTASLYIS